MKKIGWYGLVLLSLAILVSCEQEPDVPEGYFSYEDAIVNEAVEQTLLDPAIPAYVPIPVEFIIYDVYVMAGTSHEALDLSFYSRQNDFFTFQVTEGTFEADIETTDVKIDDSITASYSDNGFAKKLLWDKNGLSYKLEYRPNIIGHHRSTETISKEQLIRVAQSSLS